MSRKNGDRARSDRQYNERLHKRASSRKLRKALQDRIATADLPKQASKPVA